MRFTIRDLFWLVLLAAVLSLWWRHNHAKTREMHALIRDKATAESRLPMLQERLKAAEREVEVRGALLKRGLTINEFESN